SPTQPLNLYSFFFHDPSSTQIYTLSLHDALPISGALGPCVRSPGMITTATTPPATRAQPHTRARCPTRQRARAACPPACAPRVRSEEHTSELQSRFDLVCRLLLEKKKYIHTITPH